MQLNELQQEPNIDVEGLVTRDIDAKIGLLSLTDSCDNIRMWSLYASSHTGYVIGFDGTSEFFKHGEQPSNTDVPMYDRDDGFYADMGYARKVRYTEDRPARSSLMTTSVSDFLWTKSIEWSYECEWRVARFLDEADETIDCQGQKICLFSIPPACITTVIYGNRLRPEHKERLQRALSHNKELERVTQLETKRSTSKYSLEVVPVT